MNGKGDRNRVTNLRAWRDNYDAINFSTSAPSTRDNPRDTRPSPKRKPNGSK